MPTYVNNRSGETVNIDMDIKAMYQIFLDEAKEDHWVHYWVAKMVQDRMQQPQMKGLHEFLADMFLFPIGMGLKRVMIRVVCRNKRYKIYLSRKGTICFKTGYVVEGTSDPYGNEWYIGCLFDGRFIESKNTRPLDEHDHYFLGELMSRPTEFLAECSKDMNRCCYCNLPLEDERSKLVGYGPICATHWGLPWGGTYEEKVPSFAELWQNSHVQQFCHLIKEEPYNQEYWEMLGDCLIQAGYRGNKLPTVPERGIILPKA